MARPLALPPAVRNAVFTLAALALVIALAPVALRPLAAARLRAQLRARHLDASWSELTLTLPASVHVRGLLVRRSDGDTLATIRRADASASLWSLITFHPAIAHAEVAGLDVHLRGGSEDDVPPATDTGDDSDVPPAVAERVRSAAEQFAKALLAPARQLPTLHLIDAHFLRADSTGLSFDGVSLERHDADVSLVAAGTLRVDQAIPFDVQLHWGHDDRLDGRAEFHLSDPEHGTPTPLVISLAGKVAQDRSAGVLRVADGTRIAIGEMAAQVSGSVDTHGPRVRFAMAMDSLDQGRIVRSLPRAMLGPLAALTVRGSFDWHVHADLDLAAPDSVDFGADVIPHALEIDERDSGLKLSQLAGPFVATIHLPKGKLAYRDLSSGNPHFRTFDAISPLLRSALVTNEDGGFFVHRGFNTEAIKLAIAADLRSGSYKRGAGTITMQLVRNLYLGHQRTLSRKAQEVVLAWLLEHRTSLSKERLLEIYLNIIEWGPDLHGADEAAHWYFDKNAADLTLPEALFLTILVPSPSKWHWRVNNDGTLRSYAQAQMHFIANKMAAKGWLDRALVPPADSLRIELRGPARALLQGAAPLAPAADSTAGQPH